MSDAAKAEGLLKKVRKLEHNCTCVNCGTPAPKGVGFGHICVKFGTFVCDLCKTSHQAVSHRVKSVSMSTWTLEDVEALVYPRGGNEAAVLLWLQGAPPPGGCYNGRSRRPKQGDEIQIFKQFVIDCYENGLFKGRLDVDESEATRRLRELQGNTSPKRAASTPAKSVAAPRLVTAVPPVPEVSLLDLDLIPAPVTNTLDDFGAFTASSSFASLSAQDPWGDKVDPESLFRGFDTPVVPAATISSSTSITSFPAPAADEDLFGAFSFPIGSPPRSSSPLTAPPVPQTEALLLPRKQIDLDALLGPPTQQRPLEGRQSPMQYNASAISSMVPDYPAPGPPLGLYPYPPPQLPGYPGGLPSAGPEDGWRRGAGWGAAPGGRHW